jgi:hypothetical protein
LQNRLLKLNWKKQKSFLMSNLRPRRSNYLVMFLSGAKTDRRCKILSDYLVAFFYCLQWKFFARLKNKSLFLFSHFWGISNLWAKKSY